MTPTPAQMRLIDDLCLEFEKAWITGGASLEECLAQAPAECREFLLQELIAVELHYRVDPDGKRSPRDLLLEAHPEIADELAPLLPTVVAPLATTIKSPGLAQSDDVLVGQRETHGLHIRCPHCRNPVELLVDSPFEEIMCHSCGSNFSVAGDDRTEGTPSVLPTIGRFELVRRLGIGGFGTVWQAKDTELDRIVALKIPRRGQLRQEHIDYFFREARAAAQLKHPQIVAVHELGRDDDTVFIVSDYVEGEPLSEWMAERKLSHQEIARLGVMIAEALHHAHLHGVIHRDLKPSNVMIDQNGLPQIMDFGLAKREVGEVTMTAEGQILGTAAYMSPEQASGQSHWTDCRTDIYSLGVMLFQLITGELPFRGNLESQLWSRQWNDAPDPRTLIPQIPEDLSTICLKCLERDPNSRYASAKQVADELNRFIAGEPILARPVSLTKKIWRWARRRPWTAAALALAGFLAIAGPAAALSIYQKSQRITEQRDELTRVVDRQVIVEQGLREEKQAALDRIDELLGRMPGIEKHAPNWKLSLVQRIVDARYAEEKEGNPLTFDSSLAEAQYHSGLGFLFAQLQRRPQALVHLEAAKSSLSKLSELDPEDTEIQDALAECVEAIADQSEGSQKAQVAVDELLKLRSDAADSDAPEVMNLFDLLAARWKEIGLEEMDSSSLEQLQAVPALEEQILAAWPSDPAAIYAAACRLTFRPALLLESAADHVVTEP